MFKMLYECILYTTPSLVEQSPVFKKLREDENNEGVLALINAEVEKIRLCLLPKSLKVQGYLLCLTRITFLYACAPEFVR